ncbi:cytidylyltransferase domain-containing protein [Lignipirellula cremea]|uniref:3-deoxy-manno-octulosonate cytidylyltransferase n=1 Tax=Lignipirellula cremea TaxID=2528010 RepID=A0A518DR79_9BACT|nr:NTP transferase domain-containing protein [Lignipirellula cremea]QDU94341.1 3-deoxy-manno-octulosonate cytidylyltransferase [Lignipirellula cremea]
MMETLGIIDASPHPSNPQSSPWGLIAAQRLAGRPLLEWVVRGALASSHLARTVVLTSPRTLEFIRGLAPAQVEVIATRAIDPLARFAETARSLQAQAVVNIHIDGPLVDAEAIDQLCQAAQGAASVDYLTWLPPHGATSAEQETCVEWVSARALERADRSAVRPSERISPTRHMRGRPEAFELQYLPAPEPGEAIEFSWPKNGQANDDECNALLLALANRRWDCSQIVAMLERQKAGLERLQHEAA